MLFTTNEASSHHLSKSKRYLTQRGESYIYALRDYATKIPPTNTCAGNMTRGGMLFTTWFPGMVSRVRCLVGYITRWALLLLVLAVGGASDVMGRLGFVWFC